MRVLLSSDVFGRDVEDQVWLQRGREVRDLVEEAAR